MHVKKLFLFSALLQKNFECRDRLYNIQRKTRPYAWLISSRLRICRGSNAGGQCCGWAGAELWVDRGFNDQKSLFETISHHQKFHIPSYIPSYGNSLWVAQQAAKKNLILLKGVMCATIHPVRYLGKKSAKWGGRFHSFRHCCWAVPNASRFLFQRFSKYHIE